MVSDPSTTISAAVKCKTNQRAHTKTPNMLPNMTYCKAKIEKLINCKINLQIISKQVNSSHTCR